jgi:hypothetical protein
MLVSSKHEHEVGEPTMNTMQKFYSLALAAALLLPCVMATMAQAAQIVA